MGFIRANPTATRRGALALVLLIAFILRVWNLNWDEGTHQHPDERYWSIITSEISAAGPIEYFQSSESTLNPYNLENRDTWVYGTFPLFTTKATASFLADGPFPAGAIVTTADAIGIDLRTNGVDDFDAGYNANLVGRLLSALIDTGTVALVYFLGRDLIDRRVGFTAAVLLAFTPLHIQYAHFYGAEPWVTFFVTAAVLASLRLVRGDMRLRMGLLTGALLGLAMASKLIAAAALVVPATAIVVAVAPSIAASVRELLGYVKPTARANPVAFSVLVAALTALLITMALWVPIVIAGLAVLGALGLSYFSLRVIWRVERHPPEPALLFDDAADPPLVKIPRERRRPEWHVVAWGAFMGLVVLAGTAITYRIFQPYTFDGLASIDPRFSRDIDYLEGVNAGGNVPWVVQWVGRTPLLFPLESAFWWGMGPALAIGVLIGLFVAVRSIVRRRAWQLLPPLALLAVMLGLVSQQFNPLIRYLLPAYPVAVVFGALGVVTLWDDGRSLLAEAADRARNLGRAFLIGAGAIVVLTAFWGLAFVNGVYNTEHPRITASVWMAENLPPDATVSAQIWDDALPLGVPGAQGTTFRTVSLDPFQADRAFETATDQTKVERFIASLDEIDYVVEASNRVYDSVNRVPAKYPATAEYYEALFDGRLGFEQIAEFRNTPSLFGIDLPDEDAEETFTVYDHPTVTIWEKTEAFSIERAQAILNPAKATAAPDIVPSDAATNALLLRPEQAADVATGDTFSDTFSDDGPTGTFTWVWWLVWLQLAAFAVLPWTTLLFERLPDKGYGLSKVLGLLTVGLGTWLTVSWDLASYGRGLTWIWFVAVGAVGLVLWRRHADRMSALSERHQGSWVATEMVFLAVFGLALLLRAANPDLWEAFLGGEKPMELAYLTSIARADAFPAPDPWFAGGFMNYYYFGWYLLTVPMRALRVLPEVAFNLGVATYAAMTAAVAFSVVHNLVAVSRARWSRRPDLDDSATPVRVGILGVVLLLGIGNLDAIRLHYDRLEAVNEWQSGTDLPIIGRVVTFAGGTWAWITGAELGRFDWWRPSRVNQGNFDITEFPYFTFLFGDLHPHMMGMVFIGLTVSVAMTYILASHAGQQRRALWLAAGLGVATGVVRVVNTWDLPSAVIVAGAAIVLGQLLRPAETGEPDDRRRATAALLGALGLALGIANFGGPGSSILLVMGAMGAVSLAALAGPPRIRHRVLATMGHLVIVAATHLAVFWPFLRNNETFDTGIQRAADESPLGDFLVHWGIFLAIAAAFAAAILVDAHRRRRSADPMPSPLPAAVWNSPRWAATWLGLATAAVIVAGLRGTGALAIAVAGVVVFGVFMLAEGRRDEPDIGRLLTLGLFTLAFAISGGVEVVTVQNDIVRMNTVFKFWLQAWQYFAFAAAVAVWQVGKIASERVHRVNRGADDPVFEIHRDRAPRGRVWMGAVGLLVLAGLAYPLLGTRTRLETRFADTSLTLNGLAYLDTDPVIIKLDEAGNEITVDLADDLPLIHWLRDEVEGTPTLVEWAGPGYDWNARMAIHTGMPTVLGWDWHQKQQRWDFQWMVDERLAAIRALYTTADTDEITRFLQTYEVSYVIVGTQERRFGTPDALATIAAHPALTAVYGADDNAIYEVDREVLWPGVDLDELELLAAGG